MGERFDPSSVRSHKMSIEFPATVVAKLVEMCLLPSLASCSLYMIGRSGFRTTAGTDGAPLLSGMAVDQTRECGRAVQKPLAGLCKP